MLSDALNNIENQPNSSLGKHFMVLVPAYEPNGILLGITYELLELAKADSTFGGIIIVNDGSCSDNALQVFDELRTLSKVTILDHDVNRGKGAALKTGFSHIYNNQPDVNYVVTADADGQHSPLDVMRLSKKAILTGHPNIGSRRFDNSVPLRSRVGNILTAGVFRIATGHTVTDTQSGLRTYRRDYLPMMLDINANRYDYEFHCLFKLAKNTDVSLHQVEIETIYEPGNPTSHFNPLLDSIRIYAVLFRYASVSAISAFIDFLLFTLLTTLNIPTGPALIASRIGSMPFYIYGMRNVVFRSKGKLFFQVTATLFLMILHITFLWTFIEYLKSSFHVHPVAAMVLGMLIFYIANFFIQKSIVYRPKPTKS
ncbi:glycosyltransferase family 2 protein [Halomonas sp. SpR8]|uniref:glycosyltransferase family 2 protein n=1 Tax=Halomonas sp. SpR8 TaxID=3050463 RepID=UPI0027E5A2F4|nr:glycosyltransferase family 2 protein [Halomonas sp. SpR8]MDQ7730925.1 glycosyltransferase family 2 protein [Halomonas sp. SpR8]